MDSFNFNGFDEWKHPDLCNFDDVAPREHLGGNYDSGCAFPARSSTGPNSHFATGPLDAEMLHDVLESPCPFYSPAFRPAPLAFNAASRRQANPVVGPSSAPMVTDHNEMSPRPQGPAFHPSPQFNVPCAPHITRDAGFVPPPSSPCAPVRAPRTKRRAQYAPYERRQLALASPSGIPPSLSASPSTSTAGSVSWPATPALTHPVLPLLLKEIPFLEVKHTKRRNKPARATANQISEVLRAAPTKGRVRCAFCDKQSRRNDYERHLRTHVESEEVPTVCIGVPWSRRPNDGLERKLYRLPGTNDVYTGGCGQAFGRKDSYLRHISASGSKGCLGTTEA